MGTITVRQAAPDDATDLARMLYLFDHIGATPYLLRVCSTCSMV